MSYRFFVGVIDENEYRIAQYCSAASMDAKEYGEHLLYQLKQNRELIKNNLFRCRFTLEKDSGFGFNVIDQLLECEKYDFLDLCDSRDFIENKIQCEIAYVVNFDSNKLTCYIHGNSFVFGKYDLNNLPESKVFFADYEKCYNEHKKDIEAIINEPIIEMIKKEAIENGQNPDEKVEEFLNMLSGIKK